MGLKTRLQAIRIFYLVGSAQCKHETYAITYIVLWYSYEAIHNAEVNFLLWQ